MSETLTIEHKNGEIHYAFSAPVTLENVKQISFEACSNLKGYRRATIDLTDLSPHDSYALAIVFELLQQKLTNGCEVETENGSPEVQSILDRLLAAAERAHLKEQQKTSFFVQVGDIALAMWDDLKHMILFVGEFAATLLQALRHPRSVRWEEIVVYADRCGTEGLPIVLLICFLMGLILAFQAAIQLRVFGAEIYVADLVGLSICKELAPLMVATICTGRAGSAFAAEIGTMKVSEEIDALVTMGINPYRFLVVPRVLGLLLVMPLLTVFGDLAGLTGGFTVAFLQLDIPLVAYWNQTIKAVGPIAIMEGLLKSAVFALLIAGIGCLRGMRTRGGAEGVGGATTSAVVSGIFLIIVSDSLLTYLFARFAML